MVAHEMPPNEVLASWQHVEQRALDLRAAERPAPSRNCASAATSTCCRSATAATPRAAATAKAESADPSKTAARAGTAALHLLPATQTRPPAAPVTTPSRASRRWSAITVPLETMQGMSETPGEVGGFGLIDGDDARALVAAAAKQPAPAGASPPLTRMAPPPRTAARLAATRHRAAPTSLSPVIPLLAPDPPPGTQRRATCAAWASTWSRSPAATATTPTPRPATGASRKLQHLVRARSARCTAPGCGRPRRPLRPGPYRPLGPGRHHLRM